MTIVCGGHLLSENKSLPGGEELQILKTVLHEDFNSKTYQNDIALLFTSEVQSPLVTSICLPTQGIGSIA